MTYFVISDIHSYYDLMIDALLRSGFDINNENHIVISLGDNMDRGDDPLKTITFLMELYDKKRAILIKGNHEDLLEALLKRGYAMSHDEANGTFKTICSLANELGSKRYSNNSVREHIGEICTLISNNALIKRYYKALIDYYEIKDYILTHGFVPVGFNYGYPVYNPRWKEATKKEWEDARFYNGMDCVCGYNIRIPNKTVVVGHYHTSFGHVRKKYGFTIDDRKAYQLEYSKDACFDIFYDDGIIAIDASTNYSKKVNVLTIDD